MSLLENLLISNHCGLLTDHCVSI
uniref:Uncharacterized protein n=1 Tax=Tetranychus urticae TaxID=32264 RepID=T1KCD2_TETUR